MTLVAMAVLHARMLSGYEDWNSILTPMIVGLCLSAAAILVVLRLLRPKRKVGAYAAVATAVGMLALLLAPTVWASYQVLQGPRGQMPAAGPPSSEDLAGDFEGVDTQGAAGADNLGGGAPGGTVADPALID